jgi:hypothetical protein
MNSVIPVREFVEQFLVCYADGAGDEPTNEAF